LTASLAALLKVGTSRARRRPWPRSRRLEPTRGV